jgi:hypothetical protein
MSLLKIMAVLSDRKRRDYQILCEAPTGVALFLWAAKNIRNAYWAGLML